MHSFQDLSKTYYKKQKDSIQQNWKCPVLFKGKEAKTQDKYREFWDDRTKFLTKAIDDNDYVYDKEISTYVNGIIEQLMKANPSLLKIRPFLLLDRSASVNAYAIGNNVVAVNLGLINFCQSREELALVIAHELSHNILLHADNAMKDRAELMNSAEYKDSLNSILKSKYERLTRLKKILENYTFDRRKHQRYHEGDADSLAIRMLKNANLAFDARFFLRLDSADTKYQQPLKQDISKYLAAYNITIDEAWTRKKSKGLSSRNYNFKDSSVNRDSLKTHPDCEERYEKNRFLSDSSKQLTSIPAHIRERANKFLIWNLYNNEAITPCIYRILQEKGKGNQDEWYDFMLFNAFTSLNFSDRELHRFSTIGIVQKEYVSTNYYQLQTLLEQIPRDQLEAVCRQLATAGFWSKLGAEEKDFKTFLTRIALDAELSDKKKLRSSAADSFADTWPNSVYVEYASPFLKK